MTRSAGRIVLFIIGILILGFGVPAFWLWVGSILGGGHTPGSYLSAQTFAAILPGMVLSYALILNLCGRIYFRSDRVSQQTWPRRRAVWNRSLRDARYRPGETQLLPIEKMFVVTAILVGVAFEVWFFFFAGSPLPAGAP
jgi:multisubunit Na+/H+ antiporter MnhC subunit